MNRRTLLLLVSVLAVTACSGDSQDASPTPPPSTSAASTVPTSSTTTTNPPTTTESSSPTTDPSSTTAAPGSDDWRSVVEVLGKRRQSLYAAPDVSRINEVCADQSQCFEQLNVQLGDLATKGWKVIDADPFTVLEARVEKFDGSTLDTSLLVTVIAVVQRPANGGQIVDAQGKKVADIEAETKVGFNSEGRFILARVGPVDDPWRLASQEVLREIPA